MAYPQIIPAGPEGDGSSTIVCEYLNDDGLESDAKAAYDIVARLNAKIEESVEMVNILSSNVHFIPEYPGSPFDGHDLCSIDSYFNGPNIANPEYSFHPNKEGQEAYEEFVKNYLSK